MARVYNFSAGPAVLPEEVLKEAADEMLDYKGTGMSVMEMSHRSKAYETIINEAEADLRELMNIPDNYKVLFLQGGASQQFAMIPMNLMKNGVADYIVTGQWAKKAYQEACMYGKANKIASSEDETFSYIPDCSDLPISEDADYVYICENNTIYGTKFKTLPNTKGKTLVSDVSSCFLSEPVDVTKYGVIYGGVQKNIGPAGVVIVIIREDLITEDTLPGTPTMLQLFVIYFGPYYLFRIPLAAEYRFIAVIIAFSINYAAYFAEIYRSGIESMPLGQYEAAKVLGYNKSQTFFKIILPQVIKRVIPPVTNETITLVKDTSLAFAITCPEMFTLAKQVAAKEATVMPLMVAGLFYFIFNFVVAKLMEFVEKKFSYYR